MLARSSTPDKTVEAFQCNFQCRAIQPSCREGTNSPPSPPLVQCCFDLTAQTCISCVTANNIAIGEGEGNLLICDSKHFFRVRGKNRHFCEVSQQVLSEIVAVLLYLDKII